jgi:hypothetical protein
MRPKDFYEIMRRFLEEDKRWRALKVGDIVYEEQPRNFEINYRKMIIDSINIDERKIIVHDFVNNDSITLSGFLTQNEYVKNKYK